MVALFEVGAFTTSMQVIRNDEVLYDRDQAFGGAQLTQLIVRQYGFSSEEAETQEAQRRPAGRLRVRRAQALRRQHGAGSRPRAAVLLHQHAAQPGRLRDAGRRLRRAARPDRRGHRRRPPSPATWPIPFEGMQVGDGVREKKMRREAPSYLTSCGLAMRRFMQ